MSESTTAGPPPAEPATQDATIRPFRVDIADQALDDLRRRIAATHWPSKELVADRSQGVQLATIQELARYWTSDYDLRRLEARLNALPQFTTEIDGVNIHFLHIKSPHEHALPLLSRLPATPVVGRNTEP
jgi:Epoxide hydrolase N terminus